MPFAEVSSLLCDLVVMPGESDLFGEIAALRLFHTLSVSYRVQSLQIPIYALNVYPEIYIGISVKMSGIGAKKSSVKFAPQISERPVRLRRIALPPN
jgi:hypothetical protein